MTDQKMRYLSGLFLVAMGGIGIYFNVEFSGWILLVGLIVIL